MLSIMRGSSSVVADTGQPECSRGRASSSRAASRAGAWTAGQSSSVTLYQALSRFSPSRTSMCLRCTPSKVAPSASSAPRERSFEGVGLELDPAAAPGSEGVAELQQLRLDVRARAPGGRMEPRPADLDRPVLGPEREEPRRADDSSSRTVTSGISRPASASARACPNQRCHSSRVCGWTTLSQRQVRGSRDASQSPSSCPGASGSSRTIRPSRTGTVHRSTARDSTLGAVPIYEYACMECESHFEELVRSSSRRSPARSAAPGRSSSSSPRSPCTARRREVGFAAPSGGGGGGCCGGSCGCGH